RAAEERLHTDRWEHVSGAGWNGLVHLDCHRRWNGGVPLKKLAAIFLLAACEASFALREPMACQIDSDCGAGRVCFPDGCGDPGGGLVIEVTGNPGQGFLPQDFAIDDAGVTSSMSFELTGPLTIVGSVVQAVPIGPPTDYTN